MKKLKAANPEFRPHRVDPSDLSATLRAFDRLLARPSHWLLEFHHARGTVKYYAPTWSSLLSKRDRDYLEGAGFRFLTVTKSRSLGMFDSLGVTSETWVDPSTSIKVEVMGPRDFGTQDEEFLAAAREAGCPDGAVFLTTYFDDGSSILMCPDDRFTDQFESPVRVAMSGTGDVAVDLPRFLDRRRELMQGRGPLLCPDVQTYVLHEELYSRYLFAPDTIATLLKMRMGLALGGPSVMVLIGVLLGLFTGTHGWGVAVAGLLLGGWAVWKLMRKPAERYPQDDVHGPAKRPAPHLA